MLDDASTSYDALLTAVDKRLQELSSSHQDKEARSDVRASRQLARDAVEVIIEPHVLEWMDDDDSLTDIEFILRALAEVDNRFEKQ